MSNIEKKVFNGLVASSIIGSALSGCTPVRSSNSESYDNEKNPSQTQVLTPEEMDELAKENEESLLPTGTNSEMSAVVKEGLENVAESVFEAEDITAERISEIIDIRNWLGYEVERVEKIDPVFYSPTKENGGSMLWVVPLREEGLPNRERDVLMYKLFPGFENILKVTESIKVSTSEGESLVLGVADMGDETERGARFITLISIEKDGEEITFLEKLERDFTGQEERVSEEELKRSDGGCFHQANVGLNLFHPEVETYEQISNTYDPEYYLIGSKYDSKDTVNFIDLLDEKSIRNNFSRSYLLKNQPLSNLWNFSMRINSLPLEKSNIADSMETRRHFPETDPSSLLYNLYLSYPELNIPLGAYGYYQYQEGEEWVIKPSFAEEVVKRFDDESFYGRELITVTHRDYKEGLDFHNEVINKDFQFEFYAGNFSTEDFEVGDVILLEGEDSEEQRKINYAVVIGKEKKRNGEVVLGLLQANRFGDERLEVFASDSSTIFDLLGVERGGRLCFLRGL